MRSVRQKGNGYCFHASVTAVLRYWGWCIDQEGVCAWLNPEGYIQPEPEGYIFEPFHQHLYVSMFDVAKAISEVEEFKVTLAREALYKKKIGSGDTDLVRRFALRILHDCLSRAIPVIFQHMEHCYVIGSYNDEIECYQLMDPRRGAWWNCDRDRFEHMWYTGPCKDVGPYGVHPYMQLIIRPRNGESKAA